METKTESITTVINSNGVPIALIKRDEVSKKNLVYMVREATVAEIAGIINSELVTEM